MGRVGPAPDRLARVRAGNHVLAEPGDRGQLWLRPSLGLHSPIRADVRQAHPDVRSGAPAHKPIGCRRGS